MMMLVTMTLQMMIRLRILDYVTCHPKAESQHRRSSATTSVHASACFPNSFMKCNGYTETCMYLMCTIYVCTHAIAP